MESMTEDVLPELEHVLSHVTKMVDSIVESRLHDLPSPLGPLLHQHVIRGGKRLRSLLLYLCFNDLKGGALSKEDEDLIEKLCTLLELMHNYSLIHDDIIDDDTTRRGIPCIHVQAGTGTAVLAGDVLLRESFRILLEIDSAEVSRNFFEAAARTQEGQVLEITLAQDATTTPEEYLRMIRLKTGCFFSASCRLGALVAGASTDVQDRCAHLGLELGTLYQLRDDLDDLGKTGERNAYEARDGWISTLQRLEQEYHRRLMHELSENETLPSVLLYLRHLDRMMGFPSEIEMEAARS
jgi:octaprenyl-diphosphate synthase